MSDRKILHIDQDAFFAAVEQRDFPRLRGKPVVVGGRPEQRGAVAAASYEARRYGVHSAMPSRTAAQRCKELIFVPPRFEVYREIARQIRSIFRTYTDLVEPVSLDEAYLDVTENKQGITSATEIARQMKRQIVEQTQLTASAGVSINKFLAKMASDLDKPDGLSVILPQEAAPFVQGLAIGRFHGIGKVTARKMKELGIHTGLDLMRQSEAFLVAQFGKMGHHFYNIARGVDHRPVVPNRIRKSIGAERSFAEDLTQRQEMLDVLKDLVYVLHQRMVEANCWGYTLTLKVKFADYQQITRARTCPQLFNDIDCIESCARELFFENRVDEQHVRLLGLTVSNFDGHREGPRQLVLNLDFPEPVLGRW